MIRTVATVVVGSAVAGILTGCMSSDQSKARQTSSPAPAWSETSTTPAAALISAPTPQDFVVGVIVTEQKCFGSAGCNVKYTVNPQYVSADSLPERTTVIFTVTGGEQDQVGNFTIDEDGTATFASETSISAPKSADLKAIVTQVIPGR